MHAFCNHNGVVYQHTHRDDQRAKRNPFHLDREERHEHQCADDGQKQSAADHDCGPPSHKDRQDDHHDGNRHGKVDQKGIRGFFDNDVLLVDRTERNPVGNVHVQFGKTCVDRVADFDDVRRRNAGDAQGKGLDPVKADHQARVFIPRTIDIRHINDVQNFAVHANRKRCNFIDAVRSVRRVKIGVHIGAVDAARGRNRIRIRNGLRDGRNRDILVHGDRKLWLNEDTFVWQARDFHVRHAFNGEQFAAQEGRQIVYFSVAKARSRDRVEKPEHIAKPVVDDRRIDARGQTRGRVLNLGAERRPDLGQLITIVCGLDFDLDQGMAGAVDGHDPVYLGHFLDRGFQRLGHFGCDLFSGCAGIGRRDDRLFDGKGRVFEPPKAEEPPDATEQGEQDDQPRIERLFD